MRPLVALAVVAGCQHAEIVVGQLQEVTALKAIPNPDLDLLFVIDNSPSTASFQSKLAAAFPRMIDALDALDGPLPNLHIGVVTPDMGTLGSSSQTPAPPIGTLGIGGCAGRGDDGALQTTPAMTGAFLSDVAQPDGTRARNYIGELRDVFGELARVGAGGCGFEQHLAAMRRALEHPANAGFLRAEANLAVVFVADEDDCSVLDPGIFGPDSPALGVLQSFRCTRFGVECDPDDLTSYGEKQHCRPRTGARYVEEVAPFVDALLAAKGDPRQVLVAGIIGDPAPFAVEPRTAPTGGGVIPTLAHACAVAGENGLDVADPAVRLAAFIDAFPERSQRTSICAGELAGALDAIGASARRLVGDPCLDANALIDLSDEPGVQPACEVTDVRDSGERRILPSCADTGGDCYELATDPVVCPAVAENLRVRFQRATPAASDTWTHVRCQLHR